MEKYDFAKLTEHIKSVESKQAETAALEKAKELGIDISKYTLDGESNKTPKDGENTGEVKKKIEEKKEISAEKFAETLMETMSSLLENKDNDKEETVKVYE